MTREKILIVEDEMIIAMDIKSTLQRFGYEVLQVAVSGGEALAIAMETRPDLLLMDIILKGPMDGIETAREIRRLFDIPFIYITANADPAPSNVPAMRIPAVT